MALEPAWMLGVDDLGVFGLVCSRPGHSALAIPATQPSKATFHSSWNRLERIHQVGTVTAAEDIGYIGSVSFPDPGYRPIVTCRRRGTGGRVYADEWWTSSSAADDPYTLYFSMVVERTKFIIKTIFIDFTNSNNHPLDGTTQTFDYVVWKLGADTLT